jgi:hypothetical protein
MFKYLLFFTTVSILIAAQNKVKKPTDEACKKLHESFFTYSPATDIEIYVERYLDGKQIQHRVYKKFYKIEKIVFTSPCTYILKTVEIHDPYLGNEFGKETTWVITDIQEDHFEARELKGNKLTESKKYYFTKKKD